MTLSEKKSKQIVWLRPADELRLLNYLDKDVNVKLAENKYIELILVHAMKQKSLMKKVNASINLNFDRDFIIETEFPGSNQHKRHCSESCTYVGYPTKEDLWAHRVACPEYSKDYKKRMERVYEFRIPQMEEMQ